MKKIYYQTSTGYLCNRFPKDIPIDDNSKFIEVSDDEEDKTYVCEYGKFWAVRDNKLVIVDDIELQSTNEYKVLIKEAQIEKAREYLSSTDYVVSKLNELRLEDEATYQTELEKYKDVLAKRKEARARINELEVK